MYMCNSRMPLTSWEAQSREPPESHGSAGQAASHKQQRPHLKQGSRSEQKSRLPSDLLMCTRTHMCPHTHTCTKNTHMLKAIPRRFQTEEKRICHLEYAVPLVWYRMCSNLYWLTLSYLPSPSPIKVKAKTKNFHHQPLQVTLLGNSFFFLIYFLRTPYMCIVFTSSSTVLHHSLCWEILQDTIKLHQKNYLSKNSGVWEIIWIYCLK